MQKHQMKKGILGLLAALLLSGPLAGQKFQSISIFKNGSAFIRISDTVKSVGSRSTIPIPSDAHFGTLWLSSTSASIASMNSIEGDLPTMMSFESIKDMLRNNIGKKVRLILAYQEPEEATISSIVNSYAVFRAKDRWITTDINKIETIEFLDDPVLTVPQKGRLLEVNWENNRPVQDYTLMYMRDHIGWVPEYLIQLNENSTTATLKLQANVVNDAVDMRNAEVNFVVGVPNFQHGNVPEPLASKQDIKSILMALDSQNTEKPDVFSNLFSGMLEPLKKEVAPDGNEANQQADGSTTEDYFFYTLKGINLKKGDRTSIPLLEAEVPVRHIYSVELPSNLGYVPRNLGMNAKKLNARESKVFHSIELTNQTSKPWTTGSALMVSNDKGLVRPMAQDVLPYAPKGGKTEFRITVSPDIKVTDHEQEISREPDLRRKNGETYDLVTVEGVIRLKNYKDKAVVLNIKRAIYGELQKSDVEWKSIKELSLNDPNNPKNSATWEVSLQPNEEKTITYRYTIQVTK